jgi:hypothetical protein
MKYNNGALLIRVRQVQGGGGPFVKKWGPYRNALIIYPPTVTYYQPSFLLLLNFCGHFYARTIESLWVVEVSF